MHPNSWILAAHLIGVLLWVGGMMSVYWIQRIQQGAPKDSRDRLTAMQRSLAMMMDLAAALAIGCGIGMIIVDRNGEVNNMLAMPKVGWLHAKLTLVVLGLLPVHGMIRARVKKFSNGQDPSVPQWQWSLLLAAVCGIVILVIKQPF